MRGGRGEMVDDDEGSHFSGSAPESQSRLLEKLFNLVSLPVKPLFSSEPCQFKYRNLSSLATTRDCIRCRNMF